MSTLDFIAVGDTVVDDFIKLRDARVHCRIADEDCEICMRFGDKVPFESSTILYGVGNAANAAVAAQRLGLSAGLVTNMGADAHGDAILKAHRSAGLDTSFEVQHEGAPTNYHYVLWYEDERTILINHHRYPYVFPDSLPEPRILYFSSIAPGTESYHDAVAAYLERYPNIFFCFQPGTFQISLGPTRLAVLYRRANLCVVNKEEAQRILGLPDTADDVPELLQKLAALGPKVVVISDDTRGAYALENGNVIHLPMYHAPEPPREKTGAGDAFTATTCALYATGMPLKDAMRRGMVNASFVVQRVGAQEGLATRDMLDAALAQPTDEIQ
ncbi:carbohydrate kinase family protein [Patescibacteria group bacterium]|nr:carbohydrate kinase family protein [Patescibacteria group bacterium]